METLVLYVPAIHAGYLKLIERFPQVFILGDDLLADISRSKYLERDLRRFDPMLVVCALNALFGDKTIRVISKKNLNDLPKKIFMPEDEISSEVAKQFFPETSITYESIFLRWNKVITTQESEPNPDRIISSNEFDKKIMEDAKNISSKSSDWWRQVGVVIVKDGKEVLFVNNKRLPTDYTQDAYGDPRSNFDAGDFIEMSSTIHGEAYAIAQAAKQGISLDGTSLYVTTYPCPVCAKSIAMSGIKKVYYQDGYSLFDAEKILKTFGVEIIQVAKDT